MTKTITIIKKIAKQNPLIFMETIQLTKKKDYAIVQLNRGKANAINHKMVQEIRTIFHTLASDDAVRGVIITGQPHFFSAGLDVIELYSYDYNKMGSFFEDFGNMYIALARFPKPTIAAITGHSPAGGTVIAITTDYRVMAVGEKYIIGLNEVAVNVQISEDIVRGYSFWIGSGKAHKYLLEGKLLKAEEALSCGLVDEVCPLEEVMERAERQMQHYLRADDAIFQSTKYKARKDWLDRLSIDGEMAFKETMKIWWRPDIRIKMKGFVDMLTKK